MLFGENLRALICGACLWGVTACDQSSPSDKTAQTDASQSNEQATTALRTLADDVWTGIVNESTYNRVIRGLPIEKFEDFTLIEHHKTIENSAQIRSKLAKIDSSKLIGDDLITYEILAFNYQDLGINDDDYWLTFDITAYQGPQIFQGLHMALSAYAIPDKTMSDHYLKLVGELGDILDQYNDKLMGQMERGIYLSKLALPSVRAVWTGMRTASAEAARVSDNRLQSLNETERRAFSAALDTLIETRIEAAVDTLLATIGDEYEAKAPVAVGLSQYKGGMDVYKRNIQIQTTLTLTPEEIHQRGLDAVAEIMARMKEVRDELGFTGTAKEFHDTLKNDARFIAKTPAEVEARYMKYVQKIKPKIDDYFSLTPKAAYGVRRLSLAAEPGMTFGYYNPASISDPIGYYNYNGSDLKNRSLIVAAPLIYHELLPGHHFNIALQMENEALQDYRRNYFVAAFTEGWGEYAASLGFEMNLYEDPYDKYGRYIMEIFLASRLVVDTGMNALGWSLEEGRNYMNERLFHSEVEIASETLRYSTSIPGQALAYRLGYEKLWELRNHAAKTLGARFDLKAFHNVILVDGAKPLGVMEAKVERYIADTLKK